VLCIVIAAALTWAAHSSVAVVLLVMSLAYSQFVTPEAALALALGANLGSAINPLIEAGVRGDPASRRLPVGNLINRLIGVLIALPFLPPIARELSAFQPDAAKMTAEFHLLFNVALAAIFIGLLDPVAALLVRVLTVPGVGPVVALTYRATVDVPARFRKSKAVGAVFGLTCSKYQSGEIDRSGRISRCGDEMMRVMLYEAAQSMLHSKKWSWLKAWAMQIARRRGMKKAIVALARRLAVIMHRIWVDGTEFRWTREQAAAAA
jgi:hypothetical protein